MTGTQQPDPTLLALLLCPVSRGPLTFLPQEGVFVSGHAGLAYPLKEGVPVLLAEAAMPWPPARQEADRPKKPG